MSQSHTEYQIETPVYSLTAVSTPAPECRKVFRGERFCVHRFTRSFRPAGRNAVEVVGPPECATAIMAENIKLHNEAMELRRLYDLRFRSGEYICLKCGLRKDVLAAPWEF